MQPCERLAILLPRFIVYWSRADIDREAEEIIRKVVEQVSQAGFGRRLGLISQVAAKVTSPFHVVFSKVAVSATASLAGRPVYYEHLLSARNARNALEGHSDGITLSTARLALSYLGNGLRLATAALPP